MFSPTPLPTGPTLLAQAAFSPRLFYPPLSPYLGRFPRVSSRHLYSLAVFDNHSMSGSQALSTPRIRRHSNTQVTLQGTPMMPRYCTVLYIISRGLVAYDSNTLTSLSAFSSLAIRFPSNVDPSSSRMDPTTGFPILIVVYLVLTATSTDTVMRCGLMILISKGVSQMVTPYYLLTPSTILHHLADRSSLGAP
jgi:hypothetical protein